MHTSVNATVIAPFQSWGRDVTFKLTDLQPKMASHAASREMLVKGGSALLERICSKRPLRRSVLSTMRPIYYNLLQFTNVLRDLQCNLLLSFTMYVYLLQAILEAQVLKYTVNFIVNYIVKYHNTW